MPLSKQLPEAQNAFETLTFDAGINIRSVTTCSYGNNIVPVH